MSLSAEHHLAHQHSEELFERSRSVIPGGVNSPYVLSTPWAARLLLWTAHPAPIFMMLTATNT